MKAQSYAATIEVAGSPVEVFNRINDVPKWFKDKGFEGSSAKLNDEFVFCYGDGDNAHYSKQKLVEFIPGKKVVWLVTDSKINWIKNNKEEWTNTRIIFELTTNGDNTVLHFIHEGLFLELECHSEVERGWNMIIKDWLFNFIANGKI